MGQSNVCPPYPPEKLDFYFYSRRWRTRQGRVFTAMTYTNFAPWRILTWLVKEHYFFFFIYIYTRVLLILFDESCIINLKYLLIYVKEIF
jgi:hypothetical protein